MHKGIHTFYYYICMLRSNIPQKQQYVHKMKITAASQANYKTYFFHKDRKHPTKDSDYLNTLMSNDEMYFEKEALPKS